jgi:hypothetical protein
MRRPGRYLAIAVGVACAGLIVGMPDGARADDDAPATQPAAPAAEPQRRGLPAPFDSPPFPGSDYPLGGSQLIGVPDTAVGPLMKWIYESPRGQAWKDSRVKIYG